MAERIKGFYQFFGDISLSFWDKVAGYNALE